MRYPSKKGPLSITAAETRFGHGVTAGDDRSPSNHSGRAWLNAFEGPSRRHGLSQRPAGPVHLVQRLQRPGQHDQRKQHQRNGAELASGVHGCRVAFGTAGDQCVGIAAGSYRRFCCGLSGAAAAGAARLGTDPQRTMVAGYGPEVDRFSHLVIYTTLPTPPTRRSVRDPAITEGSCPEGRSRRTSVADSSETMAITMIHCPASFTR